MSSVRSPTATPENPIRSEVFRFAEADSQIEYRRPEREHSSTIVSYRRSYREDCCSASRYRSKCDWFI